jgi:hypothetical protein
VMRRSKKFRITVAFLTSLLVARSAVPTLADWQGFSHRC